MLPVAVKPLAKVVVTSPVEECEMLTNFSPTCHPILISIQIHLELIVATTDLDINPLAAQLPKPPSRHTHIILHRQLNNMVTRLAVVKWNSIALGPGASKTKNMINLGLRKSLQQLFREQRLQKRPRPVDAHAPFSRSGAHGCVLGVKDGVRDAIFLEGLREEEASDTCGC